MDIRNLNILELIFTCCFCHKLGCFFFQWKFLYLAYKKHHYELLYKFNPRRYLTYVSSAGSENNGFKIIIFHKASKLLGTSKGVLQKYLKPQGICNTLTLT